MPEYLPSTPALGEYLTLADLSRLTARAEQLGVPASCQPRVELSLADGFDFGGPPGSRISRVYVELPEGGGLAARPGEDDRR